MYYIYHGVPDEMIGSILFPLNQMKQTLPEIYAKNLVKYQYRRGVMDRKVQLLNCLWNDVIQFLPLHPSRVFELQKNIGLISKVPDYSFFEINLSLLDPNKTVVYFKTSQGEENVEVKWIKDVNFDDLQNVPKQTEDYYKSLAKTNELPFNYQYIPHILYMGTLDISGSKIISI